MTDRNGFRGRDSEVSGFESYELIFKDYYFSIPRS